MLFVSRLFTIAAIPNRQGGKFLALEEVTDSQRGGDNTPCMLFGSLVWAWGLQKCRRFRIWELTAILFGTTPQSFI